MLGVNLENTTSDQFQLSLTGRYLRFDVLGSGSELRLDAIVGADPGLAAALYRPIWRALFVVPHAGVSNRTFNLISDDAIVARYSQTMSNIGGAGRRQPRSRQRPAAGRDDRPARCERQDWRSGTAGGGRQGDAGPPHVARRHAGQRDGSLARHPRARHVQLRLRRPEHHGGRCRVHDDAQQRRVAAAGRRGEQVLAERRAHPPVRARRRRHVVRPPAAAGGSVSTRQADAPWRLQRGRDPWRSLR